MIQFRGEKKDRRTREERYMLAHTQIASGKKPQSLVIIKPKERNWVAREGTREGFALLLSTLFMSLKFCSTSITCRIGISVLKHIPLPPVYDC